MEKIKFTILVRSDIGKVVKKVVTCSERHTADTSQDPFEVFYNRFPFTQDMPEGMDDLAVANVLSRGMMPTLYKNGVVIHHGGRCEVLLVDWEYV